MPNRGHDSAFHPSSGSSLHALFRSSSCLPPAKPPRFRKAECLLTYLSPEAIEPAAPKAEWLSSDTVTISRDPRAEMLSTDGLAIEERHDAGVTGVCLTSREGPGGRLRSDGC
jgi:hypothetical protein